MRSSRLGIVHGLLVATAIAITGCTVLEPALISTPGASPSPSVLDTSTYIGGQIDPRGTVWTGKDSGGDPTTLALHSDGTVAVSYGDKAYDDPNDTWRVSGEILYVNVYLDESDGNAEYVGTWNPSNTAIDAVMRTSLTARELTVTLTQK